MITFHFIITIIYKRNLTHETGLCLYFILYFKFKLLLNKISFILFYNKCLFKTWTYVCIWKLGIPHINTVLCNCFIIFIFILFYYFLKIKLYPNCLIILSKILWISLNVALLEWICLLYIIFHLFSNLFQIYFKYILKKK